MHCISFLFVESDVVCQAYLLIFNWLGQKLLAFQFLPSTRNWYLDIFFTWWWWWYFFTCFSLFTFLSNVLSRFQFRLGARLLFKSEAQGDARAASATKQDVHFFEYRERKAGGSHVDHGNDSYVRDENNPDIDTMMMCPSLNLARLKNQSFNIIPPARSEEIF